MKATPAENMRMLVGFAESGASSGERRGAASANRPPNAAEATPATSSAAMRIDPALPDWRGSSPMSSVPKPSTPTAPSSIMAEIAADAKPTASGGNKRAASHQ